MFDSGSLETVYETLVLNSDLKTTHIELVFNLVYVAT